MFLNPQNNILLAITKIKNVSNLFDREDLINNAKGLNKKIDINFEGYTIVLVE